MPATQRNWGYKQYVSDDGTTYALRVSLEWAAVAGFGLNDLTGGEPRLIPSATQKPRRVIYRDPTTFRTASGPVGTAADFAALVIGSDTIDVPVPGEATAVTYTLVKKIGEKIPSTVVGPHLLDHA